MVSPSFNEQCVVSYATVMPQEKRDSAAQHRQHVVVVHTSCTLIPCVCLLTYLRWLSALLHTPVSLYQELSDVFIYLCRLSDVCGVDLAKLLHDDRLGSRCCR